MRLVQAGREHEIAQDTRISLDCRQRNLRDARMNRPVEILDVISDMDDGAAGLLALPQNDARQTDREMARTLNLDPSTCVDRMRSLGNDW